MPVATYETMFAFPTVDDPVWHVGDGRAWIKPEIDDTFGFLGCAAVGGFTNPSGDEEPIYCPDPSRRRKFRQVDSVTGTPGRPELSIIMWLSKLHWLLKLQQRGCLYDLDVRYGTCGSPDFVDDWQHIVRFCQFRITELSSDDLVIRENDAVIDETATLSAREMYDIYQLLAEAAETVVTEEITAVVAPGRPSCGECGELPSDGCQLWYAVTEGNAVPPWFLVSDDRGETWTQWAINCWAMGIDARDLAVAGGLIIVITEDTPALAFTEDYTIGWTQQATGFLAGCSGRAIHSLDSRHTWIAATNGTIYFTGDARLGVEAQENAVLTTDPLNAIFAANSQDVYAVGNNNAFLYTLNGGADWILGTGPAAGVDLTAVWAFHDSQKLMVIVGTSDGRLFQSFDGGITWANRVLTGLGAGTFNIAAIDGCGCAGLEMFALVEVGTYLAPTEGRLWRTLDGGITWREIDLPVNLGVEDVACCGPNMAIIVGHLTAAGTAFVARVTG